MKHLLIAGFGDIARRAYSTLALRFAVTCVSRSEGRDLDRPQTLRLDPVDAVLHCAPPPSSGDADTRTANLLDALDRMALRPTRLVYISTSGVYGDCRGERVDETRALHPETARARRRVDAEARLRAWCERRTAALVILRAPGIYAADRLPIERLRARLPVLRREEDVYTNHIHAEDLARATVRALEDGAPAGTYNVVDDSEILMGDWMDLVAERVSLPKPRRVPRDQIARYVSSEVLSFMRESRRLDNKRLKMQLGLQLLYPTVQAGLAHEHAIGTH